MAAFRRALPLALLVLATSACGDGREQLLEGWERDGREVPQSELGVVVGPEHCGWESALFLQMLWPVKPGDPGPGRRYVRDPDGVMAEYTTQSFVPEAELPDDAVETGYTNDSGVELWRSGDFSTAYLVDADTVEAWPSIIGPGCE